MTDATPITTKTARTRKLKGAASIAQTAKNESGDPGVARTAFVDDDGGGTTGETTTESTPRTGKVLHPPVFPEGVNGEAAPYMASEEIRQVAESLIEECSELRHLDGVPIAYFWRREGGKSRGLPVFSRGAPANAREKFAFKCLFVVDVSADHYTLANPDENATRGMIYHALRHCGMKVDDRTEDKTPCAIPHDVEMFHEEIVRFGYYTAHLHQLKNVVQQTTLFDVEPMTYQGRM